MNIKHLTKNVITVYPYSSVASSGAFTYGSAVTYLARISQKVKYLKDSTGQEFVAIASIFISGDQTIDKRSKIVMPDGTTAFIKDIKKPRDGNGTVLYTAVYI
jgi:hypothetical protein